MAIDTLIDGAQLSAELTAVADAIRAKGGAVGELSLSSGMVQAIADIQVDSGIDVLSITSQPPIFENRYPSENPDIYCPLAGNWADIFYYGYYGLLYPYRTIKIKSDVNITSLSSAFQWNGGAGSHALDTLLTIVTVDGDLSRCTTYSNMIYIQPKLEEIKGTPLDFTCCTDKTNWAWSVGTNTVNGVSVRYRVNSLHVNHHTRDTKFDDASIVSVANSLVAGANTLTLNAGTKTKCQNIMGDYARQPASVDTSNLSAAVTVDEQTFATAVSSAAGLYVYTYSSNQWKDSNKTAVTLADIGITFTGTAASGDIIAVRIYDLFTASASGSTTLESFITQVKGWTIA